MSTDSWRSSSPDSETTAAIRRVFSDWDGTNCEIVAAALRKWGRSPAEIDGLTWFQIRMAFAAELLTLQRTIATTSADVQTFAVSPPGPAPRESATQEQVNERMAAFWERHKGAFLDLMEKAKTDNDAFEKAQDKYGRGALARECRCDGSQIGRNEVYQRRIQPHLGRDSKRAGSADDIAKYEQQQGLAGTPGDAVDVRQYRQDRAK